VVSGLDMYFAIYFLMSLRLELKIKSILVPALRCLGSWDLTISNQVLESQD